jgi:uncharacterized protein (TIGR03437 family)
VVAIGGQAADIALDESRGVLYIANFTANRIDVMSIADSTVHTSMNVAPLPDAVALSRDSQYLVVAHYGNVTPPDPSKNLITIINLNSTARQTFTTVDPPLGVAFVNNDNGPSGMALIVTTKGFLLMDPRSGAMKVVATFTNLAKTVPVAPAEFPGQVTQTQLNASADGWTVWGVANATTGTQSIYRFDGHVNQVFSVTWVTSPPLLARVSVPDDGSWAMIGWAAFSATGNILARSPSPAGSTNINGHAIDSQAGIVYEQIPSGSASPPMLSLLDANGPGPNPGPNLTVLDRLWLPENMIGKATLDSAKKTLYAISDSGVMILPVGFLNQYPRLSVSRSDVLFQTNFCNRTTLSQTLTIWDPGGGNTDFAITVPNAGVSVSPSSGKTPATVQVRVDGAAFSGQNGTTPLFLQIASQSAVNIPQPIRILTNNPDQDQRGTVVNVSGRLTDLLTDSIRNRFYVIRQDANKVLVFDGTTYAEIAELKTYTTPTKMAITIDQKYLVVASTDSELMAVYDLDSLQPQTPITLPKGHYARSVADSNGKMLAIVENDITNGGNIDRIDFQGRTASQLPSLGVFTNSIMPTAVLTTSPNGNTVLVASPDGNVLLYSADIDTFIASRKDVSSLGGAYAASSYSSYIVGSSILDASLVPVGSLSSSLGSSSGFTFVDQGGYSVTAPSVTGAGVIQNLPNLQGTGLSVLPTRMVEAPLLPDIGSGNGAAGAGNPSTSAGTALSGTSQAAFTRTVGALPLAGTMVVLTTSGFTALAAQYDAAVAPPQVAGVTNAADGTQNVAAGGLISVYGQQMAPVNMATAQIPLPTALADSCLSVNGSAVPLLFVSSQQINAQLPTNVTGNATLTIHTPGGISGNLYLTVQPAAPSIFRSGTAGPMTGLATVIRADDNQLITPTNPIHPGDWITIYGTGLGATLPAVDAGMPAPSSPLALPLIPPIVTLGGVPLSIGYAGLAPGWVGVYQINASVPNGVPGGMEVPLTISQGGASTSLNVRVVK